MRRLEVPVRFFGTIPVEVPDRLSPADARLLATKVALAGIWQLATTRMPRRMRLAKNTPPSVRTLLVKRRKPTGTSAKFWGSVGGGRATQTHGSAKPVSS